MSKINKILLIFIPVILLVLAFTSYFAWQNFQKKPKENQANNLGIKPLVADSEHDVLVIEECDLAVRFIKKIPNTSKYFHQPSIYWWFN